MIALLRRYWAWWLIPMLVVGIGVAVIESLDEDPNAAFVYPM